MEYGLKVLIVDDDIAFNRTLAGLIGRAGAETLQAYNAHQAIKIIHHQKIDAVISDVSMIGPSGIELLRQIKRFREDLPVIIMSGDMDAGLADEAMEHGALGFLAKPICSETLMSMLEAAENMKEKQEV